MKFLKNSKGFTLAEMLIVMAVVVVLAGAALPKIGETVEGARESNDLAAIREAYTEAFTKAAMAASDGDFKSAEKTQTATVYISQTEEGWNFLTPKVAQVADISASSGYSPSGTAGDVTLDFTFKGSKLSDIELESVKTHTETPGT